VAGILETAAQVGDFIGGVATAGGVLVAWYGIAQWRHVKRHERKSEVATRALAALQTTCEALALWAIRLSVAAQRSGASYQTLAGALTSGRELVEPTLPELRAALVLAKVYLADSETQTLDDARQIARDIEKEFREFAGPSSERYVPAERLGAMQKFFDEYASTISDVARRGSEVLGPVARLETQGVWATLSGSVTRLMGTEQHGPSAGRTPR
jgi:hypothetical protein